MQATTAITGPIKIHKIWRHGARSRASFFRPKWNSLFLHFDRNLSSLLALHPPTLPAFPKNTTAELFCRFFINRTPSNICPILIFFVAHGLLPQHSISIQLLPVPLQLVSVSNIHWLSLFPFLLFYVSLQSLTFSLFYCSPPVSLKLAGSFPFPLTLFLRHR